MKVDQFCHLHVHTEYSLLDGYGSAVNYITQAKALQMKYLACTDHASIDGLIKFQKTCDKEGIKPILGCELYIVNDPLKKEKGDVRGHVVVLIKNEIGFQNLCKMLTKANLQGFYYRPRVGFDDLYNHCQGLVILTGCSSSFLFLPGGKELFRDLSGIIPDDLYLEVMPHLDDGQCDINALCIELANQYDIPLVATNDCHYILKEDAQVQEVLLAIQTKAKWGDTNRYRFSFDGLYLRSSEEMKGCFIKQNVLNTNEIKEALASPGIIAKKCCNFRIQKHNIFLPSIGSESKTNDFLFKEAVSKLKKLTQGYILYDLYYERLSEEWELIRTKGFIPYFGIIYELIQWCKKQEIMTGPGRGSAAGSLLAYLLGITTIDPIKYDLLFSRFIAEDRIDLPDIDMDFPDDKRALIREHLEELYGKQNIASISTFLTMKGRAAIRDVARVFEVELHEVDEFAKILDSRESDEGIISSALDTPEGKAFYKKYPDIVDIAMKLEGQVRSAGQHAAALVVSGDDLSLGTRGNLSMRSQMIVSNWDMEDSEYMGLLKIDVLGLNTLTVLNEAKRLIGLNKDKMFLHHPESDSFFVVGEKEYKGLKTLNMDLKMCDEFDFDYTLLCPNDQDVFDQLAQGNTVGVFQINTYGGTKMCKQVQVKNFEMLSDILALVRPGPSDSGMTQEYIDRHNGKKWEKLNPIYEEIVKNTYGIIVYQEQIMQVIHKIAGLSYVIADKIRKIISKKRDVKEFAQYKDMFVRGCIDKKIFNEQQANDFWTMLEAHASYSFNRSHSVAYAMLAYWCAWVKYYYPTEFICASLSYCPEAKKEELVKEARRLGLKIMLPRVGVSQADKWVVKDNSLYIPFLEIKGIGERGAQQCVDIKPLQSTGVQGFFDKKKAKTGGKAPKIYQVLYDIGAFGDEPQSNNIQQYFGFPISTGDQYVQLYQTIRDRSISLEDLLSFNFSLRNFDLAKQISFKEDPSLDKCNNCKLAKECQGPVFPSMGKYNITIVGEAPGGDEDNQGIGFIGKSGDLLWTELTKYDLSRKFFHISNVVKCYPKISRTPGKDEIDLCKKWLFDELKQIDCKFILAFGNTALKCFLGKESGIMDKSGTIEWIESIGAWVCFCIHPSAVLHNPNNKQIFIDGIKIFADKIYNMGIK